MRASKTILSGDWAIEPEALSAFASDVANAAGAEIPVKEKDEEEEEQGAVAIVNMHGPVLKSSPEWLAAMGIETVSSLETAARIKAMADDDSIKAVLIDMDSPGGQVTGTDTLARAVAYSSSKKPTIAFVSGGAHSAMYWVASQATAIHAERTASIGSIGVYSTIYDTSKAYEQDGVRVHVVSSGGVKGALEDGVEVTDEALAEEQKHVQALADIFVSAVSIGRGMNPADVQAIATGQSWLAAEAKDLGLIDEVGTIEAAFVALIGDEMDVEKEEVAPEEAAADSELPQEAEAPQSVEPEAAAEPDEVAELKTRLDAAEARASAAEDTLRSVREAQKKEVIDNAVAEGRVSGDLLKSVADFALACGDNVDRLKSFVSALPVLTHAKASGGVDEPKANKLSAEQIAFAKKYGMTPEEFARGAEE